MKKKITGKNIVFCAVILILVLVLVCSGLWILESTVFRQDQTDPSHPPSKTIERDGVMYFPRQDITVMLLLCIDQEGKAQSSNSYTNPGAADMVSLIVFDERRSEYTVLCLDRDTMMQIPVIDTGGKPAGSIYGQMALAHTYGTGLRDSCENTLKAISDYLYGTQIDHYLSLRMDAIAQINDAVGGVTVDVTEDFMAADLAIGTGRVTLTGSQAISYIRSRKDMEDQLNVTRIDRQKAYMAGFVSALSERMDDSEAFVLHLYGQIAQYMVTDCSAVTLSGLVKRCADYEFAGVICPEGELVRGETHYEFHADEEKLERLILDLFYAPKN